MANYITDTIKVGDKTYEATEATCENGGAPVETESITVTPMTSSQTLYPNTGKLINQVNVNAVTNNIDDNIQPDNIKKDVEILGVTGTLVPATGVDKLQWKCDNVKSLYYEFYNYKGSDLSILEGLDTSQVEDMRHSFNSCSNAENIFQFSVENLKNANNAFANCSKLKNFPFRNIGDGVDFQSTFSSCGSMTHSEPINLGKPTKLYATFSNCSSLDTEVIIDMSNVTDGLNQTFSRCSKLPKVTLTNIGAITSLNNAFNECVSLEEIILDNTGSVIYFNNAFSGCSKAKTIKTIDFYSATGSIMTVFDSCTALENLIVKNVKLSIRILSQVLSNASLLNTAQELWDNTDNALGGARTLTMSTPSKTAIQSIYVKLVDVTDEMRENDQYIDNKKPCIECESTDEGAMTLEEYIISKNWSIA